MVRFRGIRHRPAVEGHPAVGLLTAERPFVDTEVEYGWPAGESEKVEKEQAVPQAAATAHSPGAAHAIADDADDCFRLDAGVEPAWTARCEAGEQT